jgi:endonuclease/exonuclease/phosphatase family metal-dependent hydrolase
MSEVNNTQRLRLLSYNIQVGIQTRRYSDYITTSWRHLLPYERRLENLHAMSRLMRPFDIVALQEADGGSVRSNFINQVSLLAQYAGFPFYHQQCTRNLGRIAQHSNGLLSKHHLNHVQNHKLPGLIPGRGAIEAHLGTGDTYLQLIVAHLALSQRVRKQQIAYLADLVKDQKYVILMGDFNCTYQEAAALFSEMGAKMHQPYNDNSPTYPSWRPIRQYDHILVSEAIEISHYRTIPNHLSDHLPVELEVLLPRSIITDTSGATHAHPVQIQS